MRRKFGNVDFKTKNKFALPQIGANKGRTKRTREKAMLWKKCKCGDVAIVIMD